MISNKKKPVIYVTAIVCLLGLWSIKTTNLFSRHGDDANLTAKDALKKSKVISKSREVAAVQPAEDPTNKALALSGEAKVGGPNELPKVKILSDEQAEHLKAYEKIKAKVFTSDQEKSLRKRLLTDSGLLKNLKALIIDAPASAQGSDEYTQKTLALDLLIEASEANSAEASRALIEIIQDKKIEDEKLPLSERQAMAELKADLLYNWTAKVPSQAGNVNAAIPGPVTAQIWKNAQQAQEQNRIESAATK